MKNFNLFDFSNEEFNNYKIFLDEIRVNSDLYMSGKRCAYITLYLLYNLNINLSISDLYSIYYGAIIHDIGKTKIPLSILNKKSKLNNDEKQIVQNHTQLGIDIIFPYIHNDIINNIIRLHHEKLDGSGYIGLKEKDIPIYVQAVEVADIYDALTNIRPYRNNLSKKDALEILQKYSLENKINKDMILILSDENCNIDLFKDFLELIK